MTVLGCIVGKHNIWLVLVAAVVCIAGSWVIIRLFDRAASTTGAQRIGWHLLTTVAAGSAIWCTHFIAMLAYYPDVPVSFDPVMTIVSLLIAMVGVQLGLIVAASGLTWPAPAVGGGIVGLAIVAMHYTGMMAYRVRRHRLVGQALPRSVDLPLRRVFWLGPAFCDAPCSLGAINILATGALVLAIVSLHFTGMTAFRVSPMLIDGSFSDPAALQALALAVAGVALIIVGAGLASYLIDNSMRAESYERLRHMAMNDNLTSLPNRASFNDYLDHELRTVEETGDKVALIGIDLDRFKEINDLAAMPPATRC